MDSWKIVKIGIWLLLVTGCIVGGFFLVRDRFHQDEVEIAYENMTLQEPLSIAYVHGTVTQNPPAKEIPEEMQEKETEAGNEETQENPSQSVMAEVLSHYEAEQYETLSNLKRNFYIVDSSTVMVQEDFPIQELLSMNLQLQKDSGQVQILILHTHATEAYIDSREGVTEDTVVGAGEVLAEYLREHGFSVYHMTTRFDYDGNKPDRNGAYARALDGINTFLEEHPEVEVVIDLHRDSGEKRVVTLNGEETAKIMLFNGLCRTPQGKISIYPNENLTENLAFSLQLTMLGNDLYPGLMHRIYLKAYRYNQHLRGKYLLVELGTHKNKVEEAKNAMEPFARILATLLADKESILQP